MGNKTILERQMQTYGEYQNTIRKMTREDQVKYATDGPLAAERIRESKNYQERKAEFKREMELFLRDEPRFSVTVQLTEEQLAEVTERTKQWNAKRKRFEKELRERLGL